MGATANSASSRQNGHSPWASHVSSCRLVNSMIGPSPGPLTDHRRNIGERLAQIVEDERQHPRPRDQQHHEKRDELGDEGQGHLVDLRGGLQHADDQARDQRRQQHGRRHQQADLHGVRDELEYRLRCHVPKLATSEPINRFHPSASTNSISLNGREISTGDSIIMPMDISTLATTMSMIKKGMKIMKPIWKAVFNSLVTKAGTTTFSGRSWGELTSGVLASFMNRAMSASRACLSMKPLSGGSARVSASLKEMRFSL